jgi:hypothetical protein
MGRSGGGGGDRRLVMDLRDWRLEMMDEEKKGLMIDDW